MRHSILLFSLLIVSTQVFSQKITGKVINNSNNEPIEYANIGVVDMPLGTTTNALGNFELDTKNCPLDSKVRISMIGFESATFTVEELRNKENVIALQERPYPIAEIVVKPKNKLRNVGNTNYSKKFQVCGWGGTQFGEGNEIGLKIDLGNEPVKLKSLWVRVYKQSFDSTLFRLHIRDIKDTLPGNELLKENIYITISAETGWAEVDISKYNLFMSGEIALTLEWLNVFGENESKKVRMRRDCPHKTAVVLFNVKPKQGVIYSRWGSEAKWKKDSTQSPSMYLTVIE